MNIHQFRFVQEAVRQNFNLTHVAKALFTSQPGVSKAIIELEDELGTEIFRRHGKRIRDLTEPGKHIVRSIERILSEVEKLKKLALNTSPLIKVILSLRPLTRKRVTPCQQLLLNLPNGFPRYE